MKSLVTGASGFIGSYLTRALVSAGDQVRVLIRPLSDCSYLPDSVERCLGDLTDAASLADTVTGADRVFHCGAVVSDWGDPTEFRKANVMGTRYLVQESLKAGVVKFVHVSSTDVYGHPDFPAVEDAAFRYRGWPYGDTKIDAENVVWDAATRGLPVTVIRPATVYGPRAAVIKEIISLLKRSEMVLIGRGDADAGLCYVDNLTDALVLSGNPTLGRGRAYNIADGLGVTWKQLVDSLADTAGLSRANRSIPRSFAYGLGWILEQWGGLRKSSRRPLLTRMSVELLGTSQNFPADRAREELGWTPKISFEEGLRKMEEWIKILVNDVRLNRTDS